MFIFITTDNSSYNEAALAYDSAHTGNIGAKSNSTQQKPSWKDLMLVTCIYK